MKSKFTYDEKREILERYISRSESPTNIIKSVGISKSTFYKWLYDHQQEQAKSKITELTLRNFTLLEAKVKRLEGIIEIIKKSKCFTKFSIATKTSRSRKIIRRI